MRTNLNMRAMCGYRRTLLAAVLFAASGCGGPTITPHAYEVARALHTSFNQRDTATLERAEAYIAAARDEGRLPESDFELLAGTIAQAQRGEWAAAQEEIRDLLSAQNTER